MCQNLLLGPICFCNSIINVPLLAILDPWPEHPLTREELNQMLQLLLSAYSDLLIFVQYPTTFIQVGFMDQTVYSTSSVIVQSNFFWNQGFSTKPSYFRPSILRLYTCLLILWAAIKGKVQIYVGMGKGGFGVQSQ